MEKILKEMDTTLVRYEDAIKAKVKTVFLEIDGVKKYVLSKYDPIKEAKRIVDRHEATKETLWILFGFNLGYVIKEIINKVGKKARILVIEPNTNVLEEALECTRNENWGQYPNLTFFSGQDFELFKLKFLQTMRYDNCYNINIVSNEAYGQYYISYYSRIILHISETRKSMVIHQNTIEKMNDKIIFNSIRNRSAIGSRYDFSKLHNQYKGIPALVVSAGPSLQKNIHLIKNFKGIIITGGRSLSAILKQGINPHFIAVVDPQEIVYDTFKGNTSTPIPLIAHPGIDHRILEDAKGPQYFIDNSPNMMKNLMGIDIDCVPMGGSVATLCVSCAEYMGCSPIVFIGQDLAYTDNKEHAEDCVIKQGNNVVNIEEKKYKKVKGYYGEDVYSSEVLITYLRWFEEFIKNKKDTEYINATEGGAYMQGAKHTSFKEIVDLFRNTNVPVIRHILNKNNNQEIKIINATINQVMKDINQLREYALEGERYSRKLLDEYSVYKGIRKDKIDRLVKKLENIDENINSLEKSYLANIIFCQIYNRFKMQIKYQESLEETPIDKGRRIATLSHDTYKGIKLESEKWSKLIQQAMEE